MIKEYQSIMKNDVWDVVPRPKGNSIVTSKWIYKIKHAADGSIEKYKAIFVACGFSQKEVWDDGMQGHDHTYGIEPKAIE